MPGLKLGKEAQAKFNEAKTQPDKGGILEKKGAKRKNWNERWFVLKDNYLFYCKNEKSNPQGIINLHGCTVSQIQGPTARANSFSLLAPKSVSIDAKWTNRTYFMAAKDSKEMEIWMTKLEDAGKKAVERAAAKKAADGTEEKVPAPQPTGEVVEKKVPKTSEYDNLSSSEDEAPVKKAEAPKKVEEAPKKVEEAPKETETPRSPSSEKKAKREKKSKREGGEKREKKSKKSKKSKKEKSSSSRKLETEEKPKEVKKEDSDSEASEKEEPKKKDSDSEEEKRKKDSDSDDEPKKASPKVERKRDSDDSDSEKEQKKRASSSEESD